MSDFKTRLLEEREQLSEKIDKLDLFLDSETFETISEIQQNLLTDQYDAMCVYLYCLDERIEDLDKN